MPTTLPARRVLSAEHQAIAVNLAAASRTVEVARQNGGIGLPLFLLLRFDLWLIQARLRRLRRRRSTR